MRIDARSQGHHETFKLLWEATWGNSSCEPHHHSCCDKINNRKCLQQQQLEELQRTGNERFIWGPKGWADGPLFTRCDSMVKTVLDKYFSDKNGWHFIRSENLLKASKLILRSNQRRTAPCLVTENFLEAGGSILTICDSQNYLYFEIYFYLKEIKVLRDKFLSPSPRPDSK